MSGEARAFPHCTAATFFRLEEGLFSPLAVISLFITSCLRPPSLPHIKKNDLPLFLGEMVRPCFFSPITSASPLNSSTFHISFSAAPNCREIGLNANIPSCRGSPSLPFLQDSLMDAALPPQPNCRPFLNTELAILVSEDIPRRAYFFGGRNDRLFVSPFFSPDPSW